MKLKEDFPSIATFRYAGGIFAIYGLAIFGPFMMRDTSANAPIAAYVIIIASAVALLLFDSLKAWRLGSRKPLVFKVLVPVALFCVSSIAAWTLR
jgi:hypothetical protein